MSEGQPRNAAPSGRAPAPANRLRVVMLGDIVGTPGRQAVAQQMPAIRERWQPDLVIANAENTASGSGLTPDQYKKLCTSGVDAMTLGDHVYRKVQIRGVLERQGNIIRPANLPAGAAGKRWMKLLPDPERAGHGYTGPPLYVITILGRVFGTLPIDEPFAALEDVLLSLPEPNPLVLVEVHAEATSEKIAMSWHLDGRAVAVIGTHTHVPTADARILPRGAGCITDIGMCGPHESILGRRIDRVLTHMTTSMPAPFDVAEGDPRVNGVFLEIDTVRRRTVAIERIELAADPSRPPFVMPQHG